MNRGIVYLAWGERYARQAIESARSALFMNVPVYLVTNASTRALLDDAHPFHRILVEDFDETDRIVKTRLWRFLPDECDSFLFLDVDTRVVLDIGFGFEMAERHGIAMATAPDYCLDNHWGFDRVMRAAGERCHGQNQYNTGVIFFVRRPDVAKVFAEWERLAYELTEQTGFQRVDQPFLTLAMEQLGFNPYTLSTNYNYRALAAEHISGEVRIWHSYAPVPADLNDYSKGWPPRRYVGSRRLETPQILELLDESGTNDETNK